MASVTATHVTALKGDVVGTADERVTLFDVSWTQYEAMLAWRGDAASPRYAYLEGTLEIMSPSRDHEEIKSWLGRIVEIYALEIGLQFSGVGSWTLRSAPRARGLEPDECYIIGDRNKPRPDLAIEVVWTRGSIDKLEIYRGLDVPEVWLVRNGVIEVHELVAGNYRRVENSIAFPKLDLAFTMRLLEEPTMSDAMRKMQAWVRSSAAP